LLICNFLPALPGLIYNDRIQDDDEYEMFRDYDEAVPALYEIPRHLVAM